MKPSGDRARQRVATQGPRRYGAPAPDRRIRTRPHGDLERAGRRYACSRVWHESCPWTCVTWLGSPAERDLAYERSSAWCVDRLPVAMAVDVVSRVKSKLDDGSHIH